MKEFSYFSGEKTNTMSHNEYFYLFRLLFENKMNRYLIFLNLIKLRLINVPCSRTEIHIHVYGFKTWRMYSELNPSSSHLACVISPYINIEIRRESRIILGVEEIRLIYVGAYRKEITTDLYIYYIYTS